MLATAELILEASQSAHLEEAISQDYSRVPLYAGYPLKLEQPLEGFDRLPLITKADIRRSFPENFLGSNVRLDELLAANQAELEHTSGTSEDRTPLLLPKGWWAEQEARALHLNSHITSVLQQDPQARRVSITSPACNGDISYTGTPSCEDRVVGNSLFIALSKQPFLWGHRDLERMATEALEWDPVFLDADPVYAAVFARYCESKGIRFPRLKFVLSSYEFLSHAHRHLLERVFQVPVYALYGSTETGHLLMETPKRDFHASRETAVLEILNADERGIGELIVSTLSNPLMPLLRYRIGDLVSFESNAYGTRFVLHGRAADAFQLPDGKRVTVKDVDDSLSETTGILHYQLRQKREAFQLRYVPDQGGGSVDEAKISASLGALLGCAEIQVQPVDLLMPEGSGKFRLCVPNNLR